MHKRIFFLLVISAEQAAAPNTKGVTCLWKVIECELQSHQIDLHELAQALRWRTVLHHHNGTVRRPSLAKRAQLRLFLTRLVTTAAGVVRGAAGQHVHTRQFAN